MTWHRHPGASRIVRENWHRAQCFILAQREPCIAIRDDELRNIGDNRFLMGGLPDDLHAWDRPISWFLAVVVCAGDDTGAIARHVADHGLDARRVHFYLHEGASFQALAAWRDAGLPLDQVYDTTRGGQPIRAWRDLHQLLGLHFNMQIIEDFA